MGPFEEHLREAIRINLARLPHYASLTGGRSVFVSKALIYSERLSVPFAKLPDLWSIPYRKRGIPIVELEFISMERIPPFSDRLPFNPQPLDRFVRRSGTRLILAFLTALIRGGWKESRVRVHKELRALESTPGFHVMLRHVLESMLRIAALAPIHHRRSREQRLWISPNLLSLHLYVSHLWALPFATWIDHRSAPLLAEGVPILFQDVPPIPEGEPGYN